MKKHLLQMWLFSIMMVLGAGSAWAQTWTFTDTSVWGSATLNSGAQYDENANAVTSGGVTFTGTNGFVSTAKGLGFNAVGSTSDECISIVVPAGYKATVSAYTSGNRTVIGSFGETSQTFNAGWASSTKEFNNAEGATDVTLYLYCNLNPGGSDQKKAPFLEKIELVDMATVKSFPWTANAVATIDGNKTTIKTYNSAADINEGSQYTVVVDKAIKYDERYYVLSDEQFTANVYGKTFTMGNAAPTHEINYTELENVAFYGEVEDIYTSGKNQNKSEDNSVLSNGGGYSAMSSNTAYVMLKFSVPEAAVYKLAVGMNNTNSRERGFNYAIDDADVSETITVGASTAFVQDIDAQTLTAGEHTITFNMTYSLTPIFDYLLITKTRDLTEEEANELNAAVALKAAKAELQTAIDAAKALETENMRGVADLTAAITAAETALAAEDATVESLTDAKTAMTNAIAAFNEINPDYYIVGTMTEWGNADKLYKLVYNAQAEPAVEYMFAGIELAENAQFKVIKDGEEWTWYPDNADNYTVSEAGKYIVYFRPNADGGNDWHAGVIYLAKVNQDGMADAITAAKALVDEDAVAVGKLQAAIAEAEAKANPVAADIAALQAAIDQFKADNADQEKDETAKVATNGWKKFTGNDAAGICATQFAPAIDTYDGRKNVQLAENYETTVQTTGTIIYQDITGLTNGKYKVGFYGNAFYTSGRGFESTMEDGATDVAYVFANDQKEFITARIATSTTENNFRQFDVEVTDGTIKLGMGKEKPGTNWHTMQIYQLTWFTTAKEVFAADQEELKALIAEANTLLADETKTEGRDLFKGLVAAAELCVDSKMMNITELENVIGNLKDGIAEFKQANYTTFDGKYYVQNVASGKFMAAGHDYGTRGIVDGTGLDMTLKANENKTVDFDSQVFQSDSQHFLGSNLYMDSNSWGWIIEKAGEDVYTISNGTQYIGVDAEDNLVLQSEAANWKFVTREDRIAALNAATEENGIDATFLIQGANFSRGDGRVAASWIVSDDCINKNLQGGAQTNMCAESYHSTFTIMQTIDGAPAGLYKMTAQGFYRQDEFEGDAPAAPQFFANDVNKAVPVRTGSENSMSDASASFTADNYTIEPIDFVVTKEGDNAGKIYVGITNQNNTQWVIWDNFQLTYYGPAPATTYTVTVAETQNGTVEVDKTEAAENETVSVTVTPADGYMVDEAYWTYGEGENETKTQIGEPAEGNTATFTMPAANVTITVTFKAEPVLNPYTATFTTDYDWAEVYAYAWSGTEGQEGFKKFLGDWPGTKLEKNVETGLYTVTIEAEAAPEYIIFNNGNGGEGNQTTDLAFEDGKAYKFNQPAVLPEGAIYMWESPEGETVELGGKVTGVNNEDRINYQQAGYYTICLRGSADYSSQYVTITLDDGFTLNAGDEIEITAFRNKDVTGKKSGAKLQFDGGASVTTGDGTEFVNLHNAVEGDAEYSTEPNTVTVTVPEGVVDCKTIKITRSQTGTNLFISKLLIKDLTTTGISNINADVQVEGIYNLRGQKVEKAQKGLYIINGKKVVIK